MTNIRKMTRGEEVANAISHGIGAALAVAALTLLVVFASIRGSAWHIVSFALYGTSLVVLYTFSTLAHATKNPATKSRLVAFDQISIFLLIAGTYTPLTLVALHGPVGWVLFGIEWGLALTGIAVKTAFPEKFYTDFRIVATLAYIAMGIPILFLLRHLLKVMPVGGIVWLVLGGVCYILGTVFFLLQKHKYLHLVWHILVLAGSLCHFFCVMFYVLPIKV